MEIGRLFAAYYKRQWMFQEYQPVKGSIFAITRNRRVVLIDVCSFNVSAPMRLEPRLEESMGPMLNAEVAASVPAPGQPPARTLPAELSPPPAASDARVPTKAPPGMPSSVKTVFMIKVTGAEPVPEDSEECAPSVKEEGESETRGLPKEHETFGFRRTACVE